MNANQFDGKQLFEGMVDVEDILGKGLENLKLKVHIPGTSRFYVDYYINAKDGVVEVVLTVLSHDEEIRCTLPGKEVTLAQIVKAIKSVRDQGVDKGVHLGILSEFINEVGFSILRQIQVEKPIAEVFVIELMGAK